MLNLAKIFPYRRPVAQPRLRLLCLPYAGGAAVLYHHWPQQLPPTIDVCPVELPGRGTRMTEPLVRNMSALCDRLASDIRQLPGTLPIALFGHSMGARIAFELARRLEGQLLHLFVSASPAPGLRRKLAVRDPRPTAELSDGELKERLRELGGTPRAVLDHDALIATILPIVRSDFILIEDYHPEPDAQVSCPITVFAGASDPGASAAAPAMVAWKPRTTAGCRWVELDASHFYLESHGAALRREIVHDLSRWLT